MGNKNLRFGQLAAISVAAAMMLAMLTAQNAAAVNPYIGGYRDSSTIHQPHQFLGKVSFAGTTSVTSYTGGVISMAGWGPTTSTKVMYQSPTWLETDSIVYGEPQIWMVGNANPSWLSSMTLGHFGAASSDINYIYYTFYWNAAHTQVTFYYEPHYNDGTSGGVWDTYTKVTGDTSTNFAAGWEDKTISGTSYRFKYLQFGTESGASSNGWQVKQYDMTYYYTGNTVNLSSIVAKSAVYDATGTTNDSYIVYDGTTVDRVGLENYVANADYDLKSGSTLPAGEVRWYKDSSSLAAGTRLW